MSYNYGNPNDFNVSKATDTFLVNLHQDWLLSKKLFGGTPRTIKMVAAIEAEMKRRNINPVPYEWTPPREYESGRLKDVT